MRGVAAIILAAGGSTRLGQAKAFLPFEGDTLIRRAVSHAVEAGCDVVLVVAGDSFEKMQEHLAGSAATVVHNPQWREGIGSSIKCGVTALRKLKPNADALVMLTCDQPYVCAELIRNLATQKSGIAASAYQDTLGIPAMFRAQYFEALASFSGDRGAKWLIESNPQDVTAVPFADGGIDIDTAADYEKLLRPDHTRSA